MRNLQSQIYAHSPIFLQYILTSWNDYCKSRSRYDTRYYSLLLDLEKRQYLNEHYAKKYQEKELQQFLQYAVEKSPFYQEFYKNIDIESIRTIEDLKVLPILNKDLLRKNIETVYTVTKNVAPESTVDGGKDNDVKLLYTKEDVQKNQAFLDFFKKQHGAVNLEMKRATLSSQYVVPIKEQKKIFWRDNYFTKQRIYSSYYCTQENAAAYIKNLEKFKPDFIDGLPSSIYELAKYINQNRIIHTIKPVAIFSVKEELHPYWRKEMEAAFGCPVRNHYSPFGTVPLVTECEKGKMHYNLFSGVIEISEEGYVIITNFNNYGTPLIRYDIGDKMELSVDKIICECGSIHPVIKKIHTNHYEQAYPYRSGYLPAEQYEAVFPKLPSIMNLVRLSKEVFRLIKNLTCYSVRPAPVNKRI